MLFLKYRVMPLWLWVLFPISVSDTEWFVLLPSREIYPSVCWWNPSHCIFSSICLFRNWNQFNPKLFSSCFRGKNTQISPKIPIFSKDIWISQCYSRFVSPISQTPQISPLRSWLHFDPWPYQPFTDSDRYHALARLLALVPLMCGCTGGDLRK